MTKKLFLSLVCVSLFCSCSNDEKIETHSGVHFNITTDLSVAQNTESSILGRSVVDLSSFMAIPSVSDFKMQLYNVVDETEILANSWESVDDYVSGSSFSLGNYKVYIEYGSSSEIGIGKPHFKGVQSFKVNADDSTEVNVTASLVNSFMVVNCSDAFKDYFSAAILKIATSSIDSITINLLEEDVPAFFNPGSLGAVFYGTRQGGDVIKKILSGQTTVAKTMYSLALDVDAGASTITVGFDDAVLVSDMNINVGADLVPVDMPELTASGFTSGTALAVTKGVALLNNAVVEIFADGEIKTCSLVLNDVAAAELGMDTENVLTSTAVQSLLKSKGVEIKGLDAKREKMAYVDLTELLPNLSAGNYTFTFAVTDKYNRKSSNVVLVVNVTE